MISSKGNRQRRTRRRVRHPAPVSGIVLVCALAASVSACTDPGFYLDRRDRMTFHSGDAIAANVAAQTIDPWPPASVDRNIPGNGERTAKAIERYRTNKITAPQGTDTSSAGFSSTQSTSTPSTASGSGSGSGSGQ